MKREILCASCAEKFNEKFPSSKPFPGEQIIRKKGLIRYALELLCDHCAAPIISHDKCMAVSIIREGAKPYYKWEHEYILEGEW